MRLTQQFSRSPIRFYLILLSAAILVLSGSTVGLLLWQQNSYQALEEEANEYHLMTASLSVEIKEALGVIEETALEQALAHHLPSFPPDRPRQPPKKPGAILLLAAERVQSIREIQNRFGGPAYVRIVQHLEEQFTSLQSITKNIDYNNPQTIFDKPQSFVLLQDRITPLLLTLDQLQQLHSAAHRETDEQLARQQADGNQNFLIFVSILFLIGAIVARKIYRIIALSIAEQMETKRALSISEEQRRFTQVAIENSSLAAYWMTPDAKFIYVNEAATRMSGYTREELLSMTVMDLDPDFDTERWTKIWPRNEEEGHFTIEANHRHKDGTVFPVEITANYLAFEWKTIPATLI